MCDRQVHFAAAVAESKRIDSVAHTCLYDEMVIEAQQDIVEGCWFEHKCSWSLHMWVLLL